MTSTAEAMMESVRERDARIEAAEPKTLPDCPEWCRFTEVYPSLVHDYDSVMPHDESTYIRDHLTEYKGVFTCQEEWNRDGVVTLQPAHVFVPPRGVAGEIDRLTSAEASDLAEGMLRAARISQQINGAA